jgi:hypothetical protein
LFKSHLPSADARKIADIAAAQSIVAAVAQPNASLRTKTDAPRVWKLGDRSGPAGFHRRADQLNWLNLGFSSNLFVYIVQAAL